jgi:hypothetical protein
VYCNYEGILTNALKVEGDVGADPIWCNQCGCNLDLEDTPITKSLKSELLGWATQYGLWIDWDQDTLVSNGIEMERKHNEQGAILTEKLLKELAANYKIMFIPSRVASIYGKIVED